MKKNRILIPGGAGAMAAYVIHTILQYDNLFTEIIIADQDLEKAENTAALCNGKGRALQLDVTNQKALEKAMSECEVVVNMVGPYHLHTVNIAKTAIAKGCHYIDICDDDRPTGEMLELDEEARKKGVTVIAGIGASPGLTNIFARKAVSLLDSTDTLFAGWGDDPAADEAVAPETKNIPLPKKEGISTYRHLFQLCVENTTIYEKGKKVIVPPFTQKKLYIPGAGKVPAVLVAHPEAVGLAKQYSESIPNIYTVGLLYPSDLRMLKWVHNTKVDNMIDGLDVAVLFAKGEDKEFERVIPFHEFVFLGIREVMDTLFLPAKEKIPLLFACASGIKDGKKTNVLVGSKSINQMLLTGSCTGVPAGVALAGLLRGDYDEFKGVFTPDRIFEPDTFLDELAGKFSPALNSGDDLFEVRIEQK